MALFYPEGINGSGVYLPIMTYETMVLQLQPYIQYIVETLRISDIKYSVWIYSRYTRRLEFVQGNMLIPYTRDTRVASFTVNYIDLCSFCVKDEELRNSICTFLRSR